MGAPRQLTIWEDADKGKQREDLEQAINALRARFGNKIIQRAVMHMDKALSKVDAKKDHKVYPVGVLKGAMPNIPRISRS